jgi:hypothetical protein
MMAWWARYLDAAEEAAPMALEGFKIEKRKTDKALAWFETQW